VSATELARVVEGIEADARTEAVNWPLSRSRERLYIALARAVAEAERQCEIDLTFSSAADIPAALWQRVQAALAALAADTETGD
jgi:hypothetical protein